jgi:hypothetical protein
LEDYDEGGRRPNDMSGGDEPRRSSRLIAMGCTPQSATLPHRLAAMNAGDDGEVLRSGVGELGPDGLAVGLVVCAPTTGESVDEDEAAPADAVGVDRTWFGPRGACVAYGDAFILSEPDRIVVEDVRDSTVLLDVAVTETQLDVSAMRLGTRDGRLCVLDERGGLTLHSRRAIASPQYIIGDSTSTALGRIDLAAVFAQAPPAMRDPR